jgi:uncharacterized protein (TIGR03435 family)
MMVAMLAVGLGLAAQTTVAPHKWGNNDAGQVVTSFAGIRMTGVPVERMIRFAYHWNYEIAGLPDWCGKTLWDVEGASATPANEEQLRRIVRALLEERFEFASHRDGRERTVYRMTLGENPKLASTVSEKSEGIRPTGVYDAREHDHIGGLWFWGAVGVPMEEFAVWLSKVFGVPVVDDTGTTRRFDFKFAFPNTIHQATDTEMSGRKLEDPAEFVAAVERDIGLTLVKDQMFLETLHVDRIERPKGK